MTVAALDNELRIVAMEACDLEQCLATINRLDARVVAVDAPQSPNQGLMLRPDVRLRFNLTPRAKTWGNWKLCEYELRRRNIRIYNTASSVAASQRWMQHGFMIYEQLKAVGFGMFRAGLPLQERTCVEVHPHACFAALLHRRPLPKNSLEGRLQRQLVLYVEGVDLPYPLTVIEEITRHHLLQGHLPLNGLYTHDQLDALVAAYTAYLVAVKPRRVSQLGDPEEGFITLPAGELEDHYP